MPPKGQRPQYQRGEEVKYVGDANNDAFKARPVNSKKRSIKPQPSIETDPIEIGSEDEPLHTPKKSRPNPHKSTARSRAAKQEERPAESRQESEISFSPEVIVCPIQRPKKLFSPFADEDADVYIVLCQNDLKHIYRIHSQMLMHASSWFRSELQKDFINEVDQTVAEIATRDTGIKYRFELRYSAQLKHYTLMRVGLTMYKPVEQPQGIVTRTSSTLGSNGQSFLRNGATHGHHSSVTIPQYDGSFDEVESENRVGSFDSGPHINVAGSTPLIGSLQPLLQNLSNGCQGEESSIKSEEDTSIQLDSAELDPPMQRTATEQVATLPSSPIKSEAGTDTTHPTIQDDQVSTNSQTTLEEQNTTPLATPIKAEVGPEEQMFSPIVPIALQSAERQLENLDNLDNAEIKFDELHLPEIHQDRLSPNRQVSLEEQLQIDISTENPTEPEVKFEEPQQTISLFPQTPSSVEVSSASQFEEPQQATGLFPQTPSSAEVSSGSQVEEPQQATSLFPQIPSNVEVSSGSGSQVEISAEANLTVEEPQPQQAAVLSPQISLGTQIMPKEHVDVEVPTHAKLPVEEEPQAKLNPIIEVPSSDNHNHIITKTVASTTAEPSNNTPHQKPANQQALLVHPDILEAYHSLFLCYRSFAPTISTTDLSTATKQSSRLVKIATLYGSAKLVRPHIIASLFSHGRHLYTSIRRDAPRFLVLASKLQNALIFKEALIHIVGQAPSWPWPTAKEWVESALGDIIDRKIYELQLKRMQANDLLFQSCLAHHGIRISINNLDPTTFDIWIIVQIWHDWFSQQLRHCAHVRRDEQRSVELNMYSLMAQGGEAYLKIDDVMAMVEPYKATLEARAWGNWEKSQVEKEMNIMKGYAAKTVKELMINELTGDVSKNGDGAVEYLTCTKVGEYELPWVAITRIVDDEN
ncbi:hypothetical protein SBOR_9378 [Sclerotinia borealis F-4128]|uniref:BTB domain-containing protein n=1 Tax=Sclerotinia borealis (strain F-4128) TaxID=1432307 RepID=W9C2X7_SCLBF|nr:hypothetical protein SBOR_9378 [Sclerotinia borealis F-4128]